MNVIRISTPGGQSFFCDDVRVEANGKQMYIGAYTDEMIVGMPFPTKLLTLSAVINYIERPGESSDDVRFVVSYTGVEAPLAELIVARSDLKQLPMKLGDPDSNEPSDPIMSLGVILTMVDVVLPRAGRFKVRAYRGEDEVRLGTLKVSQLPDVSSAPPGGA